MTNHVMVTTSHGVSTQVRALLDSAFSTSFVSERLAQQVHLPCSSKTALISGITGMSSCSTTQSVVHFQVSPAWSMKTIIPAKAVVLSKVTSDLPVLPVQVHHTWHHLFGIRLADPEFETTGRIDMLLAVDVFSSISLHVWSRTCWITQWHLNFSQVGFIRICRPEASNHSITYSTHHCASLNYPQLKVMGYLLPTQCTSIMNVIKMPSLSYQIRMTM